MDETNETANMKRKPKMKFGKIEIVDMDIIPAEDNGGSPLVSGIVEIGGKRFEFQVDGDGDYTNYKGPLPFIPSPIDVDYYKEVDQSYNGNEENFGADRKALFAYLNGEYEKLTQQEKA